MAGAGAGGTAALLAESVDAVVGAQRLLEVEREVLALLVLVPDDVVGARFDQETKNYALVHSLQGCLQINVSRQHDAHAVGGAHLGHGQELYPVHCGHAQVRYDDGKRALVVYGIESLFASQRGLDVKLFA